MPLANLAILCFSVSPPSVVLSASCKIIVLISLFNKLMINDFYVNALVKNFEKKIYYLLGIDMIGRAFLIMKKNCHSCIPPAHNLVIFYGLLYIS